MIFPRNFLVSPFGEHFCRTSRRCLAGAFLVVGILLAQGLALPGAQASDIKIGTGGVSGVYYPVGTAVCDLVNRGFSRASTGCVAISTGGSVDNIERLRRGEVNFAIVQSDILYYAINGFGPFKDKGPMGSLRSVVALHQEAFTVLARADANVRTFDDLRGKHVNIGNPGSGQRTFLDLLLLMKGWTLDDFASTAVHPADEQVDALCSGEVDAIVYMVGHPNDAIRTAANTCKTNLVEVFGPSVKALIEKYPYFGPSKIEGKYYPGSGLRTYTFGVRAVLVTTSATPVDTVKGATQALFNGFVDLKFSHAALSRLTPTAMVQGVTAPAHEGTRIFIEKSTDLSQFMNVKAPPGH